MDVIILRSYPIQVRLVSSVSPESSYTVYSNTCVVFQWMERKPDGSVVFRSVRAEEKEVRRYNSHKQKAMEVLFAKIQAEFEKDEKGRNHMCSMISGA